jgi:UDP-glucose 4-epimerase
VIPLFHDQIAAGGPVTITDDKMTRFLLSLDKAVDTIFAALREAKCGETYIPRVPSARVIDVASALIGDRDIETRITGIRPGEKLHEILVSEEEANRTIERGAYYVIRSILPEVRDSEDISPALTTEYSSASDLMTAEQCLDLLKSHNLMVEDKVEYEGELLR